MKRCPHCRREILTRDQLRVLTSVMGGTKITADIVKIFGVTQSNAHNKLAQLWHGGLLQRYVVKQGRHVYTASKYGAQIWKRYHSKGGDK